MIYRTRREALRREKDVKKSVRYLSVMDTEAHEFVFDLKYIRGSLSAQEARWIAECLDELNEMRAEQLGSIFDPKTAP